MQLEVLEEKHLMERREVTEHIREIRNNVQTLTVSVACIYLNSAVLSGPVICVNHWPAQYVDKF
jgi:hypothetical protein